MKNVTIQRIIILATLLTVNFSTYAQSTQLLVQQWYSRINRNPAAVASGREDINMAMFYHNQWSNVDGAPQTLLFNGDLYFNNLRSGFGLSMGYDTEGKSNSSFNAMLSYGYLLNLSNEWKLSMGLSGGIKQFSHDPRSNTFVDPTAPEVQSLTGENTLDPDFNFGAELYFRGLTAGFAVDHILNNDAGTTEKPKTPREYYLYGRYNFVLNNDFDLAPQASYNYIYQDNVFEIGATSTYKKFAWFGGGWRINTALSFMAGAEFYGIRLGYAYQMSLSETSNLSNNTHEIMLQYTFKNWRK